MLFLVLKNFEVNAEDGRVVFRTVVPTPRPMVIDMVLGRSDGEVLERTGARIDAARYQLSPTVHWLLDPIIRLVAPRASFWVLPGDPPAMVRYQGPRNYARQPIVIQ